MSWTGGAIKLVADSLDRDPGACPARIHVIHRWTENVVGLFGFEQSPVFREVAGIPGEIFVGPELGRIDKNGSDHDITLSTRCLHQRDVPLMQGAHCRHEADALARTMSLLAEAGHFGG